MKILNTKTSDLTVGQSIALSLGISAVTMALCTAPMWVEKAIDKIKEVKRNLF